MTNKQWNKNKRYGNKYFNSNKSTYETESLESWLKHRRDKNMKKE